MQHPPEFYEHTIQIADRAAGAGAATGVVGFLFSSPGIGLMGVVAALIGVGVSAYFQWRRDKREHAEHLERMKDLQKD